jgi:ketosteroid isomerase-like protein
MSQSVSPNLVQEFYRARLTRDPARIAPFLDDDVEWSTAGPVDLFHFCGQRRGKTAVLDAMVRIVPSQLKVSAMELEELLVDGDRAATISKVTATQLGTNRVITYRQAQFFRFRNNKIVSYRCILDSFDAAEQLLGRAIDLPRGPHVAEATPAGDLVAV